MTAFLEELDWKNRCIPYHFHELSAVSGLLFISEQYRQKPAGMVGSGAFFWEPTCWGPWRPCLFRRMAPVRFLPGFSIGYRNGSLICVAAYFIVRLGWLFRIWRKARRQYRLKRLGKTKNRKFACIKILLPFIIHRRHLIAFMKKSVP